MDTAGEGSDTGGRTGVLLDKPRDDGPADDEATDKTATDDTARVEAADTGVEPSSDAELAGAPGDGLEVRGKGRRSRKRAVAAADPAGGAAAAVTDGAADEPQQPGTTATTPSRLRRSPSKARATSNGPASQRQKIAALLLGLVIIGLLVPVVIMRHRIVGQSSEDRAVSDLIEKRTVALTTARQFAVTFFSPDYKTIDDYNKSVLAGSTGQFNQDFASKQGDLKSLVTQVQSKATGRILAAGVSKVSGDDVEVLVVADQDVQNTLTKGKAQTLRTRVRVTVHKTDKGWLVSSFEPVT